MDSDKIKPFVHPPRTSMPAAAPSLALAFGLAFEDLYGYAGLARLDGEFLRWLADADSALAERFAAARAQPAALAYKEEADLLIAAAPHAERFIAKLFSIEEAWEELFSPMRSRARRGSLVRS